MTTFAKASGNGKIVASLTRIREALRDTIKGQTVAEIEVYDLVEDMGEVPCVIIEPDTADFEGAMNRGMDVWDFTLYVLTSRNVDSANGQELLDKLVSGAGEDSIRQILFENSTLGLTSTDAHCYALKGYGGKFDWARVPHVGAVLKVTVRTDGRE